MHKVILVVDDEPLVRLYFREILEGDGYAVEEASNVDEALVVLDKSSVSAVVTDIEMPGMMDGLALAKVIRALWPSMLLIVTSGQILPGPDDLPPHTPMLTKPFSAERLLLLMRSAA